MSPPNYGRGWREGMEVWLDLFRGYADALDMSADVAATLATTILGIAVLVYNAVHERREKLSTRIDAVETDGAELKRAKSGQDSGISRTLG